MTRIEKAKDIKEMLFGVALSLGGLALAVAAFLELFTLRIFRIPLPPWVVGVGGLVVVLIGVGVTVFGASKERCIPCRAFLEGKDAYFPLESIEVVADAVTRGDPGQLGLLPAVPKNQMKSVCTVLYCPTCRETALVGADKWQDQMHGHVVPVREVSGPPARGFADVADRHVAGRGEQDDD